MFGGIVEDIGLLCEVRALPKGSRYFIEPPSSFIKDLKVGESLSVNGACLTLSEIGDGYLGFDISPETLARTYFSNLKVGDKLNLERPLKVGDRLHGHWVTGHIDGTGTVAAIEDFSDFKEFVLELPEKLCGDLIPKGSISVDGVSLTINRCSSRSVSVMLVPQTLERTTFGEKKIGDPVQVELDLIGKYVKKWINHEHY
ncbi:MAG: riboflavin synthase [Deltaproteobacteria bacterium]